MAAFQSPGMQFAEPLPELEWQKCFLCRRSLASESLRQCSATSSQTRIRARICCCSQQHPSEPQALALSRRAVVSGAVAGAASTTLDRHAQAASFPSLFDKAWEAVGGGPADLYFPDAFSGRWIVTAMLNKVEMPLGAKFVPDVAVRPLTTQEFQSLQAFCCLGNPSNFTLTCCTTGLLHLIQGAFSGGLRYFAMSF